MSRFSRPRHASPKAVFELQTKEDDLHPQIVKQARKSGQLNLENRGLVAVPDKVWHINETDSKEAVKISQAFDSTDDERWWDRVELSKLNLSSNKISRLSNEISNLDGLQVLNLRDNLLVSLPNAIGALQHLHTLNLSRNKLAELPLSIYTLKELRSLDLSHNGFTIFPEDIGNLNVLEDLNISNNQVERLPHTIGYLSKLTKLNLSNNNLQDIPPEIGCLLALQMLDLTYNKLTSLPSSIGELCRLVQFYVHHNRLQGLPLLHSCAELTELYVGYNVIAELASEHLQPLLKLKVLDLRDNKISTLPEEISILQGLERLDLGNNYLNNLPYAIATLPNMKVLALEGNPLRSIRRDILQRGTVQLLKFLKSRMEPCHSENLHSSPSSICQDNSVRRKTSVESSLPVLDLYTLKKTRCLDLSNRKLETFPEEYVKMADEAQVTILNLNKNQLSDVPESICVLLPRLTEFHISGNKLTLIPQFIESSKHLTFLDLSNNKLSSLPDAIASLVNLREIWLSRNRFEKLPEGLYALSKLEIILASDNSIKDIDVEGLSKLKLLTTLDLQNNSIGYVPPELGNLTQLRSLQLEGNPFRHPRLAVLSKGTLFLLEYLRGRITEKS